MSRPDRPLVVKTTYERWNKRITFTSARNCTYELLRDKVSAISRVLNPDFNAKLGRAVFLALRHLLRNRIQG
jgi:hypothetical protein